jgi:hypothetical protein
VILSREGKKENKEKIMARIARPTKPLADVNVLPQKDGSNEIIVCFMLYGDYMVDWGISRAALAIDGSCSMKAMFGLDDSPNYTENVARKLGEILCRLKLSEVTMFYWATGAKGAEIEVIGEFDEVGCESINIVGPNKWVQEKKLLPCLRHIFDVFSAGFGVYIGIIITDGFIDDEKDCMKYCIEIRKQLATGKHNELKLVFIGLGSEINEDLFERFDEMFEGTCLEEDVPLWSYGLVKHMRDESDIIEVLFGGLRTEDLILASSGSVLDDKDNEVISFPDGMPGKFRFILPNGCKSFTVRTPKGDIIQDISGAL